MPEPPRPPPGAELDRKALMQARAFFQALGQAAKLVSLYHPTHPVPSTALRETAELAARLFKETGLERLSFSLADGRWLVNGTFLAESGQVSDVLLGLYRVHHVSALTIVKGALLFELSALCELAALPSHKAESLDLPDALKQRGVRRILVDVERYEKAAEAPRPPAAGRVESPLAAGSGPGNGGEKERKAGLFASAGSFGALIKSLVEGAVSDPDERAQIYAETVRMVREAMERRVSAATSRLEAEKRAATFERARTERVFEAVAHGRVVVDRNGRVLMMDPQAESIVGRRLVEMAGKPLTDGPPGQGRLVALSKDLELDPARAPLLEVSVAGEEAAERLRRSMALVHDERGRVVGAYGMLPDQAKLAELERLGDEFISSVTHELKAPLASIYSALELVSGSAAAKLSDQERKFLSIGARNVLKLRQMIEEILDFSKIQSGRMTVHPEPQPLGPIVEEGLESLRPWASSRGMALEAGPGLAALAPRQVRADRRRVVEILTNLISNAIKATPDGGRITVDAAETEGFARLSVCDTGCGIAREDLERIFERFTQVVPKGGRREGVGLGLAIVRQLVGLHGGTIEVKSEPGKGSTFAFTLPLHS